MSIHRNKKMKKLLILGILLLFPVCVFADLTATEGLAIDLSSAGVGLDFTIAFDTTELLGNRTWGDASTDTIVWTWNRATGTDPTITFNSGSIALQALTLTTDLAVTEGGTGASTLNDLITLTTHTTGNYVKDVADGTGIDGTAAAEGATYTPTFDATELTALTWSAGGSASWTWTFDISGAATDPVWTFGDGSVDLSTGTLKQGGTSVSLSTHNHSGTYLDIATYDVSADDFVDGNDTTYAASWNGKINAPSMNAVYDKIETLPGGHDAVTVTDSQSINLTLSTQNLTADVNDKDYGDVTVSGTGSVWTVEDNSHAHTTTTISGLDISDDTNLSGDVEIVLTGDVLSIGATITRDSEVPGLETNAAIDSEAEIEAITGAYFGASKVVTAGYIWVADGTDFESVPMSGDVSILTGGATAVADESHAHTTTTISGIDISADTNLTAGDHITLTDDDLDVDDDFILNTGDSGTGVYDFGGATSFEIPNGADPDLAVMGQISVDSDGGNEPNSVSLRVTDTGGDTQYVLSDALKIINIPIANPDALAETSFQPVWKNKTGFSFIITEINGESNIDDFDFTLKERDADGGNVTTIEAVQLTTNGTSMYYGQVLAANIDHTTIEAGHTIGYDNSADDATYVIVVISGYFDGNVN